MHYCDSCDKDYQHKRSLDRHVKEKHIQHEITGNQLKAINIKDNKTFVHQYLDFWGCNIKQFPPYLPECVKTLIIETRDVHKLQYETIRTLCGTLTKYADMETLLQIVDEMFKDEKYNWGRIVTLFSIAIEISEHARKNNYQRVYYSIPQVLMYALNRADNWLQSEGGWDKFVLINKKL